MIGLTLTQIAKHLAVAAMTSGISVPVPAISASKMGNGEVANLLICWARDGPR
jgi:hypothetical protein